MRIYATSNVKLLKLVLCLTDTCSPVWIWWDTETPQFQAYLGMAFAGWAGHAAAIEWAVEHSFIVDRSTLQSARGD